ncbi:MAG TPA: GDSL-type esterase/lipase family protein, partial [Polyangiaceae bacterium]|nr:GDSL-type esterase/lipase family protein [Polyangiaceae bacterium]
GGSGGSSGGVTKWVATWAASPYLAASDAQPPVGLSNSVLRQVTHVSLGGSKIRVQFSNLVGDGAVSIKSAHIAISGSQTQADGTIDATTDKALTFSGMETVTIAAKMEVWSDPIDFTMMPLSNVSITTALGSVPTSLTAHAGSRTTSYVVANSTAVNGASLTSPQTTDHWYFISGIDVMAPDTACAAVAIGDSITDGRGTDTNKNNRWTDVLAKRLHDNPATANVAMINQGIGATTLIGTGTGAETRFARDVLAQSGVKYAIVLDGVNDIHNGATADAMKAVYAKLISAAKAKQVKIYGATILPFGGSSDYYSASAEQTRVAVNTYIKSGVFDGVIDFDMAMSDGGNPPKLPDAMAAWSQKDGLHPGPAGYQKMGETPDLALFTK